MTDIAGRRIGLLSTWLSRRNGGVFEAVVRQTRVLREIGAHPVIFGLEDADYPADVDRFGAAEIHCFSGMGPDVLGYARTLRPGLIKAELDLLHLHGIWQYPSRAAARWQEQSGLPLLISPHGMLDPWIVQRNNWKKQLGKAGYERRAWKRATAMHALTQAEADDIARETNVENVQIIANPAPRIQTRPSNFPGPNVLYLGRIHEKKNVVRLPAIWSSVRAGLPSGARLTIAGWGSDEDVQNLRNAVGASGDDVEFVGPAYGGAKQRLLNEARFLILPSQSEGLPMAILDAWSAGVPTIQTDACHLDEGIAAGSALRTGQEDTEIGEMIRASLRMDSAAWLAMSEAAIKLASTTFHRDTVARQWELTYGTLLT